ncbi:flagellar basal body rod protein FlgC [soil metagenome]
MGMGSFNSGDMAVSTFDIAGSGLHASMARLDASASNIANAGTTGSAAPSFLLNAAQQGVTGPYQPVDIHQSAAPGGGVSTLAALRRPASFPLYDPSSPSADASGMVASPNVNPANEIVEQIHAAQAYKLNLSMVRTAQAVNALLINLKA